MGGILTVPFAATPHLSCCCNVLHAGLEGALLLFFGSPDWCFLCMLVCSAFWLWCMFKGACSLCIQRFFLYCIWITVQGILIFWLACAGEHVPQHSPLVFYCGQGSLFPWLEFVLFCWFPACIASLSCSFWSIYFLHLIKKKKNKPS